MFEQKLLPQFRPEIDGLRAVAIVPVLFFHAGITAFAGGFFGVDVFFVISGYLITSQLLSSDNSGWGLLQNFYHRRIRRLFPAIAIVSFTTALVAFIIMTPSQLKPFFSSFTSTQIFTQNFFLWQNSGYWDQSLETSPLMHTWSLAVEEQFYLVFPLLFIANEVRRNTNLIIGITSIVFVLSFFAAITRFGTSSMGAFFLLPYRAWELMAGALVALVEFKKQKPLQFSPILQKLASNLGLILILIAIIVSDQNTYHPGPMTVLMVLGTTLLIAFGRQTSFSSQILSTRIFTDIGKLSYGLYLWHYPILALWRVKKTNELVGQETLIAIAITFVLAYLMWRFAETPFRDRVRTKTKTVTIVSSFGLILLLFIGIYGQQTAFGKTSNFELALLEAQAAVPEKDESWIEVDFEPPISGGIMGSSPLVGAMGEVVMIGDSHSGGLRESLSNELKKRNISGMIFTKDGCPLIPKVDFIPIEKFNCAELDKVIDLVVEDPTVTDVILFSRWTFLVEALPYINHKGYREGDAPEIKISGANKTFANIDEQILYLGDQIKSMIDRLESAEKRVHLIYPLPELGWEPVPYAKRFIDQGKTWHHELDIPYEDFKTRAQRTFKMLKRVASPKTNIIRSHEVFCNNQIAGWCVASIENTLYYGDNNHLNENGNKLLASFVVAALGER